MPLLISVPPSVGDGVDFGFEGIFVCGRSGWNEDIGSVIENDDANDVGWVKLVNDQLNGFSQVLNLLASH
jgi:hypothetical protein